MDRTPFTLTLCALIISTVLGVEWLGLSLQAQKAEQKQDVKDPRLNESLKGGWQLLLHERCRFAVPGSWRPAADGSSAAGPDGSNISIRMFKIKNWSLHKAQIKAAFGRVNVMHEDSERRLWFEIGVQPRIQHYIGISNGGSVCSALLETRGAAASPDAQETTRRIVASISAE
jgi:hypothetical protein